MQLVFEYFKENIHKIFWGCLLLPMWNAVGNMGWNMITLVLAWVGECCSEPSIGVAFP